MLNPGELMRLGDHGISLSIPIEPAAWPETEIADAEVIRVARAIRLHYYRQILLLRQIPYFALEANGRGGWLDKYHDAYRNCRMAIHKEHEDWGRDDMYIELRSGVFISAETSETTIIHASNQTYEYGGDTDWYLPGDKEVYQKLAHQSERNRFNPPDEIKYMQKMMLRQYHNDPEELEAALKDKAMYKVRLDIMMEELPQEQVIDTLRAQGFDL